MNTEMYQRNASYVYIYDEFIRYLISPYFPDPVTSSQAGSIAVQRPIICYSMQKES